MVKVELLPHNEIAYEKLIKCLKNNNIATINHATGTGKSFILLKYMLENSSKRIMFMAPTYEITDQIKNEHPKELGFKANDLEHVDTLIYPNLLMIKDIEEFVKKYDVFIFDEYHRCGAKQWGRIINKIKKLIKEKYPEKLIIGTTATEIRYLDNERNMKDLLFDGVEASRLTFSDAILNGILPVPYYINIDLQSLERIEILKNKVKSYVLNKKEQAVIIDEIEKIQQELIEIIYQNEEVQKYIKPTGKYFVFSASKEDIKKDQRRIKNFFAKSNFEEYIIHSGISREKNQLTLERFRRANKQEKAHILYSINLLTEGVHVKDVDAEFQCRKTTSPILYFQLIGRILSYSQRKDQVVIFDLANNLQHHPVIYTVYSELVKRAKELIKTNPENKAKYEEIISKLKIVDKTSDIYKKIEELEKKYSKENLIKIIIENNIKRLENSKDINYIEIYKAESIIKKYHKYIDLNTFIRIKKLGILKDQKMFQFTVEEFKNLLRGYDTLYELLNKRYKLSYEKIKIYMLNNYRIPSLFSSDKEEQELAIEMCNNFEKYTESQKKNIRSYINEEDTIYERLLFGKKCRNLNYAQLVAEIEYIMSLKLPIKNNIIVVLKNNENYLNVTNEIEKYNSKVLKDILDDSINAEEINYLNLMPGEISRQSAKMIEELIEKYEKEGIEKVLEDSYIKILDYIKKYKELPVYVKELKENQRILGSYNEEQIQKSKQSKKLYLLRMILNKLFDTYGYTEKINNMLLETKKKEVERVIENVINFMKENNYSLPSIEKTGNPKEISLAIAYRKVKGKLTPEQENKIKQYLTIHNQTKDDIVDKMCNFILKNIGKPTIFEEQEIEFFKIYNKYQYNFTEKDKNKITRARKISELFYFIIEKNYEIPSQKNDEAREQALAKYYCMIKNNLSPEEKEVFESIDDRLNNAKKEFIKKYKEFIKKYKRLPLLNKPEEKELVFSYNRWTPYLTKSEKDELQVKEVNRYQSMLNAYEAMKGRKI